MIERKIKRGCRFHSDMSRFGPNDGYGMFYQLVAFSVGPFGDLVVRSHLPQIIS
jgi:hypothetical protein